MSNKEIEKKILTFLSENKLSVVSTVDSVGNKPESAVVAFAETENLELIFCTSNTSRKYKNIQTNPAVSFVIGWDGRVGTVQYEGVAREVSKSHSSALIAKSPYVAKFSEKEDARFFLVTPKWIRLVDMSKSPNETFEISF